MIEKRKNRESYITWEELKKELNYTPEEEETIKLEVDLIEATIKAREEANLSQRDLGEKTGMKQSAIARIERMKVSPTVETLMHLLYPLGYTLRIVPLDEKKIKNP